MPSARDENELYQEAHSRCLTRHTSEREMFLESADYFEDGLRISFNMPTPHAQDCIKSETNEGFAIICGMLAKVEACKGVEYKASWQKRGTRGVLSQIERKFDRVFNLMNSQYDGSGEGESSLTTTLGDMAVYCIKEITRRKEMFPKEFENWVEEIRRLK